MINLPHSPRERMDYIQDRIQSACDRSGRSISDVSLIGASKGHSFDHIRSFLDFGLTHIGENYLQESENKVHLISDFKPSVQKHFIGHVQTNKVKKVLQLFDYIHSVDSVKLVKEIDKRLLQMHSNSYQRDKNYPVFVEINLSGDKTKTGCNPAEAFSIVENIVDQTTNVECIGLMTISPFDMQLADIPSFYKNMVNNYFNEIHTSFPSCKELSMGMSNDFEPAIEAGSTYIRIGTLLFGSRA
jgi:hypothetical protein